MVGIRTIEDCTTKMGTDGSDGEDGSIQFPDYQRLTSLEIFSFKRFARRNLRLKKDKLCRWLSLWYRIEKTDSHKRGKTS